MVSAPSALRTAFKNPAAILPFALLSALGPLSSAAVMRAPGVGDRVQAWRAIARSPKGDAPDILKKLRIPPDRLGGFSRVMAHTSLDPQADLTDAQIREAVGMYITDLLGRAKAASRRPDDAAALSQEMRDLPVLEALAPKQARDLESAAERVKSNARIALTDPIRRAGDLWSGRKEARRAEAAAAPAPRQSPPAIPRLARCNRIVAATGQLPSYQKNSAEYSYWRALARSPEEKWPEGMSARFTKLLHARIQERRPPLARCNRIVEAKGRLPTYLEDISAHGYWGKLARSSQAEWPEGMSDRFRELLRKKVAERRGGWRDPLMRCNLSAKKKGRLPDTREDQVGHQLWMRLARIPESRWPGGMNDEFKELLRNAIDDRGAGWRDPLKRCSLFAKEKGRLPSVKEDGGANQYWQRLARRPESRWPEGMSRRFRMLLQEKIAQRAANGTPVGRPRNAAGATGRLPSKPEDPAASRYRRNPLDRCNRFVGAAGRLPAAEDDVAAYQFWLRLARLPESEWPEDVSGRFRKALRRRKAQWAASVPPLIRCNLIIARTGKLPTQGEDINAYVYWRRLLKGPRSKWPKDMGARFEKLLRAKVRSDRKRA